MTERLIVDIFSPRAHSGNSGRTQVMSAMERSRQPVPVISGGRHDEKEVLTPRNGHEQYPFLENIYTYISCINAGWMIGKKKTYIVSDKSIAPLCEEVSDLSIGESLQVQIPVSFDRARSQEKSEVLETRGQLARTEPTVWRRLWEKE